MLCRQNFIVEEEIDPAIPDDTNRQTGYQDPASRIRALPEIYREILELKCILEWNNKEIARHLNISDYAAAQCQALVGG